VIRPRLRRTLAGRLCPNAVLGDGRRFDDVAAGRFALVTTARPTAAQRLDVERRGVVVVHAAAGTDLHRWLRRGRAAAAVVRPDGTVLRAARDAAALRTVLPRSAGPGPRHGPHPGRGPAADRGHHHAPSGGERRA
jgi:3-(3-hydroxy-phenyl)propionate hydroxylase